MSAFEVIFNEVQYHHWSNEICDEWKQLRIRSNYPQQRQVIKQRHELTGTRQEPREETVEQPVLKQSHMGFILTLFGEQDGAKCGVKHAGKEARNIYKQVLHL